MIFNCNPKCKKGGGSSSASLDVAENKIICDTCNEELTNVTSFAKSTLKSLGLTVKKNTKVPFGFKCTKCGETKKVRVSKLKQLEPMPCKSGDFCEFNISSMMINTILDFQNDKDE